MKVPRARRLYAIHPGWVFSASDGEEHFISFSMLLLVCWSVPRGRCICWDDSRPETFAGRLWDDYIHLTPRYYGDYILDADGLPPASFGGYRIEPLGFRLPTSWEKFAAITGWRMKQKKSSDQSQHLIDLGYDCDGIEQIILYQKRIKGRLDNEIAED